MNLFRGSLRRTNGVLVLCACPFLVRVWIEAVAWRVSRGPQMLGFSFLHGGAGYLTIPILLSLLALQAYLLWAAVIGLRSAIARWRSSASEKRLVAAGALGILAFLYLGDSMQVDLSRQALYAAAAAMTVLLLGLGWLVMQSFAAVAKAKE